MQGIFITGTSTNVGKTYTAVKLAKQLTRQGIPVIPRKPIESGCLKYDGELMPQDAIALQKAANYQGSLSEVCPFRFEPPISPLRAAHLINKVLTTEQLAQICIQGSEDGFLIVEGAGGFYSPIAEDGRNADLAIALQLPIVLVARDSLGCINQVELSIEAIKHRGLKLAAVVLSQLNDDAHEQMDNTADLRKTLRCPIYSLPYNPDGDAEELPAELIDYILSIQPENATPKVVG